MQNTSELYSAAVAVEYYQNRYADGYMDEWPLEKKQRIFEIIRSLHLPKSGEAIDFGCGNGVMTNVIKQALPTSWNVYGVDISAIAIENAKKRYPECAFYVVDDNSFCGKKFDFLFTHHVLEHVFDLSQIINDIDGFVKEESAILHILPCGNIGSLEHSLCLMKKDGINPEVGNRFFFEDDGHVRRLTSGELNKLYCDRGFSLAKQYYSSQFYGAIDWITQTNPQFIAKLTDAKYSIDKNAKRVLTKMHGLFLLIWILRYPAVWFEVKFRKTRKTFVQFLLLLFVFPLYICAKPMDLFIKGKSKREWQKKKTEPNGSEMFLCFKRYP